MKNIAKASTIAVMMIAATTAAGSAMADSTFPCSKVQFWITSMQTVPAGPERHRDNYQINIADVVLKPREKTFAQDHYQEKMEVSQELVAGLSWSAGGV